MNDEIKNHISLWLPALPVVQQTTAQRRLRAALPAVSQLTALPEHWSAPLVTKLDPRARPDTLRPAA